MRWLHEAIERDVGQWVAMRRGCKRLDTSTQGEYTKSKAAYENLKDFNVSARQSQILPLRPSFLTTEVVTGNDMGDETRRHDRPRLRRCMDKAPDYESGGQEFESLRARQQTLIIRAFFALTFSR
jgi:hypothetical protein